MGPNPIWLVTLLEETEIPDMCAHREKDHVRTQQNSRKASQAEASEETKPPDYSPPEWEGNHFVLCKPRGLWDFVLAALAN